MVLVSRKNRKMILEYLFKEGVLAVKKDGFKAKHDDIDVPNLHVMMVMKSLASRDLVKEMARKEIEAEKEKAAQEIEALRAQAAVHAAKAHARMEQMEELWSRASGAGVNVAS